MRNKNALEARRTAREEVNFFESTEALRVKLCKFQIEAAISGVERGRRRQFLVQVQRSTRGLDGTGESFKMVSRR